MDEWGHIDSQQFLGQRPYSLDYCHLSELHVSGVNPCLPDRTQLDSCLGMDKVIVSTIEDEKNNVPSVSDIAECWADIYNKVFIDEAVTKHLQVFKPNFLRTVEHTVLHQQIKVPRQNVSEIFDSDGHWG